LRSLEYAIIESLIAIRRNAFHSIASILTVTLTLGVLGAFSLFALSLNNAAKLELKKFEIEVWLDKTKSQDDIIGLERQIRDMDRVETVTFISAKDYWKIVHRDWKDDIDLKDVDPKNVMAKWDHFSVRLNNPRYTAITAKTLRTLPHVREVIDGRGIVDKVSHMADIVRIVGAVTAGILLLITMIIVSNTIRLMMDARKREIRIMQLVGATNWFIRLPLIFEGTLLGTIGGGIACVFILGGSEYLNHKFASGISVLSQFSSGVNPLLLAGALLCLGWVIGAMASLISIQRYLKA